MRSPSHADGICSLGRPDRQRTYQRRGGFSPLYPLVVLEIGSAVDWETTHASAHDDIRRYAFAQFGSLLLTLLPLAPYPPRYTQGDNFVLSPAIEGIAKLLEAADRAIFFLGRFPQWPHAPAGRRGAFRSVGPSYASSPQADTRSHLLNWWSDNHTPGKFPLMIKWLFPRCQRTLEQYRRLDSSV
jgi:hypothetical protein